MQGTGLSALHAGIVTCRHGWDMSYRSLTTFSLSGPSIPINSLNLSVTFCMGSRTVVRTGFFRADVAFAPLSLMGRLIRIEGVRHATASASFSASAVKHPPCKR